MDKVKDLNKNIISRDEFDQLLETHDPHCISVYIPTSRGGEPVKEGHAQLILKNKLRDLRYELQEYGMSKGEASDYLEPMEDLLEDQEFWHRQSDCLTLFLDRQGLKTFTLPIEAETFIYVSDHFYLLPVMSIFGGDGIFYLLALSLGEVRFYEATRFSITRIEFEDQEQQEVEDAAGSDGHEKSLQFRTGQGGGGNALYHGQGAGKDNRDEELRKYMRAVDSVLMKILKGSHAPLLLACVDSHYPIYSEITEYNHLLDRHIKGNPDHTDPILLHEKAWPLVRDQFQQERKEKGAQMQQHSATGRTSLNLDEIIKASVDGRIDTLMVMKGRDRFGLYDSVNRSLIIDEGKKPYHASLYNMAAVQTWLTGGQVYLTDEEAMPLKGSGINALFRY